MQKIGMFTDAYDSIKDNIRNALQSTHEVEFAGRCLCREPHSISGIDYVVLHQCNEDNCYLQISKAITENPNTRFIQIYALESSLRELEEKHKKAGISQGRIELIQSSKFLWELAANPSEYFKKSR